MQCWLLSECGYADSKPVALCSAPGAQGNLRNLRDGVCVARSAVTGLDSTLPTIALWPCGRAYQPMLMVRLFLCSVSLALLQLKELAL